MVKVGRIDMKNLVVKNDFYNDMKLNIFKEMIHEDLQVLRGIYHLLCTNDMVYEYLDDKIAIENIDNRVYDLIDILQNIEIVEIDEKDNTLE